MKPEQAKALREPFDPKLIGKLPKAGITLDFVGHAATTDRLLQVDPDWSWEPMGRNPDGTPAFDEKGGLWILLTVCGVTRPGYGEPGRIGAKEAIGDAIRNAAMRFGVALDLWSKEDLQVEATGTPSTPAKPEREDFPPAPPAQAPQPATLDEVETVRALVGDLERLIPTHNLVQLWNTKAEARSAKWDSATAQTWVKQLQGELELAKHGVPS